jgi:hypothetical protein
MHEYFDFPKLKLIVFSHDGVIMVVVEEHDVAVVLKAVSLIIGLIGCHLTFIIF